MIATETKPRKAGGRRPKKAVGKTSKAEHYDATFGSAGSGDPRTTGDVSGDTLEAELQAIEWTEAKIDCDEIDKHPANRHVSVPDCAELAESIRSTGRLLERVKLRSLPGGRYQMLGGQRRLTAHVILDWPAIEAEVCECSDAAARALVSLLNSHRKDLNPIEKARDIEGLCTPVSEGGAGMTREAAAQVHGLATGQAASNLVRLLELPEQLQEHVANGRLAQSYARRVVPYAAIGKPLLNWLAKEVKGWDDETRPSRADFEDALSCQAERATRPMAEFKVDKWTREYQIRSDHANRLFEPTDDEEVKLKVVELPMADYNGKSRTEKRAVNTKLWDKLQKAATPAALKRLEDRKAKKKAGGRRPKAEGKKKELTPQQAAAEKRRLAAEEKRRREEAAKKTAEAVKKWRWRFLRCLTAAACTPGDWRIRPVLDYLTATARRRENQYRTKPAPMDELLDAAVDIQAKRNEVNLTAAKRRGTLSALLASLKDERDDEATAGEELDCLLLQLILWPQCEGHPVPYLITDQDPPQDWRNMTWQQRSKLEPVELLELDASDVEAIAELFEVSIAEGWKRSGKPNTRERSLVIECLDLHTREQLDTLAKELLAGDGKRGHRKAHGIGGPAIAEVNRAKSKAEAVDTLLSYHTAAAPLKCPKVLQPSKRRGRKPR